MIKHIKLLLPFLSISLLSACVTNGWKATNHYDEFTDTKSCRVELGSQASRDFMRGFSGAYVTKHFYAENYNGEIRAGIRTEPALPIGGDIQIKVGEKLYTLTSQDTPIDVAPSASMKDNPFGKALGGNYAKNMEYLTNSIHQFSSPYRAFTGTKAKALLRDIAKTSGKIKHRTVGVNKATSTTGFFVVGEGFEEALIKCGIEI